MGAVLDYEKAYDPIILLSQSGHNFKMAEIKGDWDGLLFPSKIVISDLDNDGDFDIVFSANGYDAPPFPKENFGIFIQQDNQFSDLNEQYPTLHNSHRGDGSGSFYHSAAVGDLNHDLSPDIFMGDMRQPFIIDGKNRQMFSVERIMDPNQGGNQVLNSEIVDVVGGPELELVLVGHKFTSQILTFDKDYNITNVIELPDNKTFEVANVLGVASGDINADGLNDLIFTMASENYRYGSLQVLLQTESREFEDVSDDWFVFEPYSDYWTKTVSLMDIDGDADLDLILGQTEANDLHYYENVENKKFDLRVIEDPLSGWGRFHVGIDEENLNFFLVNNTTDGDLIIGEGSFA